MACTDYTYQAKPFLISQAKPVTMDLPLDVRGVPPYKLTRVCSSIFPIIFIVTLPLWYICTNYSNGVVNNPILSFLNHIFVQQYGYLLFTIAYLGFAVYYIDDATSRRRNISLLVFKFCLITLFAVIFHGGFWRFLVVELINRATGGYCSGAPNTTPMRECEADRSLLWVSGFDISSHYYFLLSLTLMIGHCQLCIEGSGDIESQVETPLKLLRGARALSSYLTAALSLVWIFEFVVTSLFFHTPFERFVGLVGIPVALFTIRMGDKFFPNENDDGPNS